MATKITKKEMFAQILAVLTDDAQKDFIKHEIELLEKKASTPRKLTPAQLKSVELRDAIATFLQGADHPVTIKEVVANVPALVEADATSPQKVSRLIADLGDKVEKSVIKKVTHYVWVTD